ncbi:uncharacterized protein BO95DRAFT_269087 [Aspergillus brunneoviolaceus CBS 621.78]|uniref:Uncharacterized protein n=1 Tax=Aspergillus brunneoviolaceus CBS 621.78 TaxID=1450534 RepID=A0ACD1GK58_9EURO|nr:hypothetical protein BO95DRAFT_269087 [Aspergillus brunneoviolaceus CBS 621.78]RAH49632.1 hypothetical protein BO95DRAFT_269087 [Aspergillus brunneoviolaceus CBS 621.78]
MSRPATRMRSGVCCNLSVWPFPVLGRLLLFTSRLFSNLAGNTVHCLCSAHQVLNLFTFHLRFEIHGRVLEIPRRWVGNKPPRAPARASVVPTGRLCAPETLPANALSRD